MKTKRELLQNKLQQFNDEYNLYVADVRNRFLQNNHSLSAESSIILVDIEKKLICDYFNGFTGINDTKVEAHNQLYLDHFQSTKAITDADISAITSALETYWNKWKSDLLLFLNQNFSDAAETFTDSLFESTFKPIISLESKRILNKLHELQIIFYIPFFKKFLSIFTPIAAVIGFITGVIQFSSSISPYVINLKTFIVAFFK